MQKYPLRQKANAIYDNDSTSEGNPFLAALPALLSKEEFFKIIRSSPQLPVNLAEMTSEERRQALPLLSAIFIPLSYMYITANSPPSYVTYAMSFSSASLHMSIRSPSYISPRHTWKS